MQAAAVAAWQPWLMSGLRTGQLAHWLDQSHPYVSPIKNAVTRAVLSAQSDGEFGEAISPVLWQITFTERARLWILFIHPPMIQSVIPIQMQPQ
jgi:hypothetical protein